MSTVVVIGLNQKLIKILIGFRPSSTADVTATVRFEIGLGPFQKLRNLQSSRI